MRAMMGGFRSIASAPENTGAGGRTAPSHARPRSARVLAGRTTDDEANWSRPREDPVETMLAAADAARAAGHPDEAGGDPEAAARPARPQIGARRWRNSRWAACCSWS